MTKTRILLGLLVVAVVAAPSIFDHETETLDRQVRKGMTGRFVQLSDGITHYDDLGPKDGHTIVLVHGFSSPYYIWDTLPGALLDEGYRVIRYDLFGRGFSDRPDIAYGPDDFHRQLDELLDALRVRRPVHLIGLSMGGAISVGFAATHTERVRSLTLIDPAGMPFETPGIARLLQVPLLGEWVLRVFGDSVLIKGNRRAVFDKSLAPKLEKLFSVQLRYKGFKRAIRRTLANMPIGAPPAGDMASVYREVGALRLPTLVFWGRADEVVPSDRALLVKDAMPHADLKMIDEAGHLPHYEKPEAVIPALLAFYSRLTHASSKKRNAPDD